MSKTGIVVDPLEFARQRRQRSGEIPLSSFDRLADALASREGSATFSIQGFSGKDGAFLDLEVSGVLQVTCQRCLGPLDVPVEISNRLLLIPAGGVEPEGELADDTFDAIPAEPEMDLLTLVEDELVLALPLAPRHDHCDSPGAKATGGKPNPFAALEKLKRG